jgi:hypothetical protein
MRAVSGLGGSALAAATHALARVRSAAKPLHPVGELWEGRLERDGSPTRSGVAWLDEPGEDAALVRLSRAVGLPDGWPDVHGLAVRVAGVSPADVLFATTGTSPVLRHLLTVSRRPRSRPMTTLLPYRAATGPIVLAVTSTGPRTYELSWARLSGDWSPFGRVHLLGRCPDDPDLSFDPVRHQLPGLEQYPAVVRLREPAYRQARRSRAED